LAKCEQDAKSGKDQLLVTMAPAKESPLRLYGCGNADPLNVGLIKDHSNSNMSGGRAEIPYYWCNAGYSALGVTSDDLLPAKWSADKSGHGQIIWTFPGRSADLYLSVAKDLREAARNYAGLTGHAPVPPKWAFGYLQSRWGWENKAYIDDTLKTFRQHQLPVDAFILDFECYTVRNDYGLVSTGTANFPDFRWNPSLFPNPSVDIAKYLEQGIRIIPIRKPRIGDSAALQMMHEKGWLPVTGNESDVTKLLDPRGIEFSRPDVRLRYADLRRIDFSLPQVRQWYADHHEEFLKDGIAGWWNDEGESGYTKYYFWNMAQCEAEAKFRPNLRHWSLNRSFEPGLQRLGCAAWTGDIHSSWTMVEKTPTSLLNWSLAGMPYSTCDIGGYDMTKEERAAYGIYVPGDRLARWMEEGVFFPVMRTHSVAPLAPHFPWMGGAEAENAIRKALQLRYRLIPYYYSLAHETFETGIPIMRPLIMEFPGDAKVADLSSQWLMGSQLMAAPILTTGTTRTVYIPDTMYPLEGGAALAKGREIQTTAGLDQIPVYVREGTILPLGPVIQNVTEQPGGPLELRIYPGKNASFTLVEDDGLSTGYLKGVVRKTRFDWNDTARTLAWKRSGDYGGKDVFKVLEVVLMNPEGKKEKDAPLEASGKLGFE
jgi:alpha-glucosidase